MMHLLQAKLISPLGDILVFVCPCSGQVILLNSMEVAMEMLLFLFLVPGRLPQRQVTSDSFEKGAIVTVVEGNI
jgi:hypothetical protein